MSDEAPACGAPDHDDWDGNRSCTLPRGHLGEHRAVYTWIRAQRARELWGNFRSMRYRRRNPND